MAADALLLGYGINGHASGAILWASLMPLFMLVVPIEFGRHGLVAAYVAIQLERKLDISDDTLMSMQVATRFPAAYKAVLEILNLETQDQRIKAMRKGMQRRLAIKDSDTIVFVGGSLLQIGIFLFVFLALGRPII